MYTNIYLFKTIPSQLWFYDLVYIWYVLCVVLMFLKYLRHLQKVHVCWNFKASLSYDLRLVFVRTCTFLYRMYCKLNIISYIIICGTNVYECVLVWYKCIRMYKLHKVYQCLQNCSWPRSVLWFGLWMFMLY